MHPRTRLVYFYFFRVNFLVKASTSGRCDEVWLPWQRCICRSRYGCFCLCPQVTYLHTKIEGGLKFYISNFASLSWRIALKALFPYYHFDHSGSIWVIKKAAVTSIVPKFFPSGYTPSTLHQGVSLLPLVYSQIHVTIFLPITKLLHTPI